MEVETGVMVPQAKEYQGFLADTRNWKRQGNTLSWSLEGSVALLTP